MQEFDVDLEDLEKKLRSLGTDVYLLAAPNHRLLPGQVAWNFKENREASYWLWIEVCGAEAKNLISMEFGIVNDGENLSLLKHTGFIVQK